MDRIPAVLFILLGLTCPLQGWGESGFGLESIGGRAGFSSNKRSEDFHQAEAFLDWATPWDWEIGRGWTERTRLECSVGWLGARGEDAAVLTLGPEVAFGYERIPIWFDIGMSPTLITRQVIENTDFGTQVQFTSHVGVYWDVWAGVRLGYRFQHMSNGSMAYHNPGLNLHMFALSISF